MYPANVMAKWAKKHGMLVKGEKYNHHALLQL
jgi:hypothetical protein